MSAACQSSGAARGSTGDDASATDASAADVGAMSRSDSRGVDRLADRLFRRSYGRLVGALTRALGPEHLSLAEDVVQDALIEALQTWPFRGVPENPEGWLYRVAHRRALDRVRRSATLARKMAGAPPEPPTRPAAEDGLLDDELTMMFLTCHPALTPPLRVGLTLKVVAGFGVDEIAAAFLARRTAIQQRLVRAKRILREDGVSFEMPPEREVQRRLEDVLQVLYLVFNEGYAASAGDSLIRSELCGEAIRLATGLASHRVTDRPEVHALLALLHLQASRLPARTDELGRLVLLEDQDRERWDREAIARGLRHLERAAAGTSLTVYHVEAGIASCHAVAPSVDETDWATILDYYDRLLELRPSPVVRLNRAVAVAMVHGPMEGVAELEGLEEDRLMSGYHLLPAVRGRLLERAGRSREAAAAYRRAASLARTEPERAFLRRRLAGLGGERVPAAPYDEEA